MSDTQSPRYHPERAALSAPAAAPGFDGWAPRDETTLCAELSRLVYGDDRSALAAALERIGFEESARFDAGDTFGLLLSGVFSGVSTLVLVFRGTRTDKPQNLLDDALALLSEWPTSADGRVRGHVHLGFRRALDRISADIAASLATFVSTPPVAGSGAAPQRLLITGHSLGAALATLAAARWAPGRLITFGSPRVGDRAFASSLSAAIGPERITRVVNCADIVCDLPTLPFKHVGQMVYYDRSGVERGDLGRAARFADATAARLAYLPEHATDLDNLPVRDLADHAPVNYVNLCRRSASA